MKKYLLLLLFYSLIFLGYAQTNTFVLEKTLNANVYFPQDISIIQEAGIINILDLGKVVRFDAYGNKLNSFSIIPAEKYTEAIEISTDREGNIYVLYSSEPFIRKFSPDGRNLVSFGSIGIGQGQFKSPGDITSDPEGNVYVSDVENHSIQKFNNVGQFQLRIGSYGLHNGEFISPKGVALDHAGNLYVVDGGNSRIQKFNRSGQYTSQFDLQLWDGWQPSYAESIAVDREGSIYISHNIHNKISKLDPEGNLLLQIGRDTSNQISHFNGTKITLALDALGNLYTADRRHGGDSYVHKFNSLGQSLGFFGTWSREDGKFNNPQGVAIDNNGNFYVADANNRRVQKFNASGQFISKIGSTGNSDEQFLLWSTLAGIAVDINGNVYTLESTNNHARVQKFSASGSYLRKYEYFGPDAGFLYTGIAVDVQGNIYLSEYNASCIRKISANGQTYTKIGTSGTEGNGQLFAPLAVALDKKGNIYVVDSNGRRIQKFSNKGEFLLQQGSLEYPLHTSAGITADDNGFVYVAAGHENFIQIYNANLQPVEKINISSHRVAISRRGDKLIAIEYLQDAIHLFTSATFSPKENVISGNIYQDTNNNCTKDSQERGIPGVVVTAEPGPYFGVSDTAGYYRIQVDTGSYTLRQILPQFIGEKITENCPAANIAHTARFTSYNNSLSGKDFGNLVSVAAYLSTSVTSNRRRRCFTNTTTVTYANAGYAAAENVQVYVQLPEQVIFQSANKPYTKDASGNYVFDLGTLSPNQTGTIAIQDSVVCDDSSIRGLTQCTKTWITPANTYTAPVNWDRSDIAVEARCLDNGMVRFAVKNSGQGNMADSLQLRIFLDAGLALNHTYRLNAGDSLILRVPVNGRTVRLEADEHSYHPVKKLAHATVEACGLNAEGKVSIGFANLFPVDVAQPEVSIDCQPIIDSFDPNDKLVSPEGLTDQFYTPTQTDLQYKIRFQNTGTDTAYRVVVVDTLSSNLDLSTLQMGTASHAYQLSVSGKGNPVLTWTFNNINLPDSTKDQLGSNGYLSFSVKPKAGLPEKEEIENFADIFFDYNEPVRTNTVINRIYDMPYQPSALQLDPEKVIVSPVISEFSPAAGRFGTLVTLSGKNFDATPGHTIVRFNSTPATILSVTSQSITVQIPVGATTGKISIQTPDGTTKSNTDFIIYQPPLITGMLPAEIVAGSKTPVTISGVHFASDIHQDTVFFNGRQARILSASPSALTVEVPENATTGKVWLGTLGGTARSTLDFVVWYPPLISHLSADTVKIGSQLIISGKNFAELASRNILKIGQAMCTIQQASATELRIVIPADAQTGYLQLETPGGIVIGERKVVVIPQPKISHFTPTHGFISTKVTLHGNNFGAFATHDTLYVNTIRVNILQRTDTTLTFSVPKEAQTGKLSVYGLGGHAISKEEFIVEKLPPGESVTIYPNPAKITCTLDFSKADFYAHRVKMYSTLGILVVEKNIPAAHPDKIVMDLPTGLSGMFVLLIDSEKGTIIKKIIVQ